MSTLQMTNETKQEHKKRKLHSQYVIADHLRTSADWTKEYTVYDSQMRKHYIRNILPLVANSAKLTVYAIDENVVLSEITCTVIAGYFGTADTNLMQQYECDTSKSLIKEFKRHRLPGEDDVAPFHL